MPRFSFTWQDCFNHILPDQYQTIRLAEATVQLDYCRIEEAIIVLREQYAVGMVTAKIVQPRPL